MTESRAARVPVEVVQRMVRDSGLTLSEICRRKGWVVVRGNWTTSKAGLRYRRLKSMGDTARLKRWLGILPSYTVRAGNPTAVTTKRFVKEVQAIEFCKLLDLDPADYDLG